jgi:hypothetical protein
LAAHARPHEAARLDFGVVLCRKCGIREVPPRQTDQPGRPRTTCFVCQPVKRAKTDEERERGRAAVRRSRQKRRHRQEANYATTVCGCANGDYLTRPLEAAHACPNPLPLPEPEPPGPGQGVYDPSRYPWRE